MRDHHKRRALAVREVQHQSKHVVGRAAVQVTCGFICQHTSRLRDQCAGNRHTLTLTAGCDRRFASCAVKFANTVNFRGFPHIPGSDFVLGYPKAASVLNGEPLVR